MIREGVNIILDWIGRVICLVLFNNYVKMVVKMVVKFGDLVFQVLRGRRREFIFQKKSFDFYRGSMGFLTVLYKQLKCN